jgi:putative membrane protein
LPVPQDPLLLEHKMSIRPLSLVVLALSFTGAQAELVLTPVVTSTRIEGTRLKPDEAEKEFMHNTARAGMAEIKASELALKKATDPDVKRYAQRMLEDHRQAHTLLVNLAKDRNMKLPEGPSGRQNTKLKRLQAAKGIEFDRRYIDDFGADTHDETIGEARRVLAQGRHAPTKQLASDLLPKLEQHLTMARELQSKLESHAGRNQVSGGQPGSNLPPPAAGKTTQ